MSAVGFVAYVEAALDAAGYGIVSSPFTVTPGAACVVPAGQSAEGTFEGYFVQADIVIGVTETTRQDARDTLAAEIDRITALVWTDEGMIPSPAAVDVNPIAFGDPMGDDEDPLLVIVVPVRAV